MRAYFRPKWRLLCLLSFKHFLATRTVLKLGDITRTVFAGEYSVKWGIWNNRARAKVLMHYDSKYKATNECTNFACNLLSWMLGDPPFFFPYIISFLYFIHLNKKTGKICSWEVTKFLIFCSHVSEVFCQYGRARQIYFFLGLFYLSRSPSLTSG